MSTGPINIIDAIKHPALIGDTVSPQQEVILRAIYGLPLQDGSFITHRFAENAFVRIQETAEEFYCRVTEKSSYRPQIYREAGIYPGARSGKSDKLASNIAIFEACLRPHKLSRGEKALVPVIAYDKKQAGVVYNYIRGKLESSPTLSKLIGNPKAEEIELTNGLTIGVYPCSFRQLRGYSVPAAVCDEIAVWRDEETRANPAEEVIRAVRRGMATFPYAKLIKISSPFGKSGVVWKDWSEKERYSHSLILKAPSWEINPTLSLEFLLSERDRDVEFFEREFGAQFWDAVSALLPPEKVDAAVAAGVTEREPQPRFSYFVVIDVAFKYDNFAVAVCHRDGSRVVFDLVRAFEGGRKNPVKMADACLEVSLLARRYGQHVIRGDQYCAEPIRQAFLDMGLEFKEFTFTGNSKQALYANLRALFMSGGIEIPQDPDTISELKTLEAVAGPGGSVKVQAAGGYKDDRATVVALGAFLAMQQKSTADGWVQAFKDISAGREAVAREAQKGPVGATTCVDCGITIPFGQPYYGLGAGLGQCMPCAEKGQPNFRAVLPMAEVTVMSEAEKKNLC